MTDREAAIADEIERYLRTGEVGAVGEPQDAGLEGALAIERGGVVHRDRP